VHKRKIFDILEDIDMDKIARCCVLIWSS
jgi:hypothetical protein